MAAGAGVGDWVGAGAGVAVGVGVGVGMMVIVGVGVGDGEFVGEGELVGVGVAVGNCTGVSSSAPLKTVEVFCEQAASSITPPRAKNRVCTKAPNYKLLNMRMIVQGVCQWRQAQKRAFKGETTV